MGLDQHFVKALNISSHVEEVKLLLLLGWTNTRPTNRLMIVRRSSNCRYYKKFRL